MGFTLSASAPRPAIVCRHMTEDDGGAAVALLCRGFPERTEAYWTLALRRLRERDVPRGLPRYGYVMSDHGRLVGIVLIIFSLTDEGSLRGNTSSWYVEPAYRGYSSIMLSAPLRLKEVTFVNISPRASTIDTIDAQGFRKYVDGTFHTPAATAMPVPGLSLTAVAADMSPSATLLQRYAGYGCLSFEAKLDGASHPFVFARSRLLGDRLPCAQLVYCRALDDFVRFAGPLGRRLLRHGLFSVMVDANGPIAGLPGRYFAGRRVKYYRGTTPPRLGDLSETELVLFGH